MAGKVLTSPAIAAEGVDEYLLENGNTISKEAYDKMWNPKKGVINLKAYRTIGSQVPNSLKNKKTHSGKIKAKK